MLTLHRSIADGWRSIMAQKATIERLVRVPDSSGGTIASWTTIGTTPCYVGPLGGGERIIADRLGLVDAVQIIVPAGTNVAVVDRLTIDGRVYQVAYVPADQRDAPLIILASEVR